MSKEKINWDNFYLKEDDTTLVVPCVYLKIHLHTVTGEVILDFYNKARKLLGDNIKRYDTSGYRRFKNITRRSESMVPTWLKNPTKKRGAYYIEFLGGGKDDAVNPYKVTIMSFFQEPYTESELPNKKQQWIKYGKMAVDRGGEPHTDLVVTLPVDHPMAQADIFRQWVLNLDAINNWPLVSATAGYGVIGDIGALGKRGTKVRKKMQSLLRRNIGLDKVNLGGGEQHLRYDLSFIEKYGALFPLFQRVAWLTCINELAVNYLGGTKILCSNWKNIDEIKCYQLKHGLMIQAGEKPELGSLEKQETVPLYRAIAGILRPVRVNESYICGRSGGLLGEFCEEWLNALEQDY